jgi:hypothetical protein
MSVKKPIKLLFENTMILPLLVIPPNNLQKMMFSSIRKFWEIWIINQEKQIKHKIPRTPGYALWVPLTGNTLYSYQNIELFNAQKSFIQVDTITLFPIVNGPIFTSNEVVFSDGTISKSVSKFLENSRNLASF